jgi:E3 ubiquitin-protein ligase RGLG
MSQDRACESFDDVQKAYKEYLSKTKLSGPTNFAPIINKAVEIVRQKQQVTIIQSVINRAIKQLIN